jgi:hypothetical protein
LGSYQAKANCDELIFSRTVSELLKNALFTHKDFDQAEGRSNYTVRLKEDERVSIQISTNGIIQVTYPMELGRDYVHHAIELIRPCLVGVSKKPSVKDIAVFFRGPLVDGENLKEFAFEKTFVLPFAGDRVFVFTVGTQLGTIIPPTGETVAIHGVCVANPDATGTIQGTVQATIAKSAEGTITGTLNQYLVRDKLGDIGQGRPLAVLEPGEALVGRVSSPDFGSILGLVVCGQLCA